MSFNIETNEPHAFPIPKESPSGFDVYTNEPRKPKCFVFGFRHWKQIDNFGINARSRWFVSLLERLKEMGKEIIEEARSGKKGIRFHTLDWGAKNIPIKKQNFAIPNWLGSNFFENFELQQFHISKALGRVIGFFDIDDTFQIVLLDKDHNAQPSGGKYKYKVTRNAKEDSDYDKLLAALTKQSEDCKKQGCSTTRNFKEIKDKHLPTEYKDKVSLLVYLDPHLLAKLEKKCTEKNLSIDNILEQAISTVK